MDGFLTYFFQDFGRVLRAFADIFVAFFNFLNYLLNFPMRMEIIEAYDDSFNTLDWIMLLIANISLVVILILIIIIFVRFIKPRLRFRVQAKEYNMMAKRVQELQRDVLRANYEKDRLLNMRLEELGGSPDKIKEQLARESGAAVDEDGEGLPPEGNRNTIESPCVNPEDSRFFRLTTVDNFYKTSYTPPIYDDTVTLAGFCEQLRAYAASELHLYYELDLIRNFVASLGTARIIILQGISGTGKTSLPYAFGRFVNSDATVVSVQPAWRERTELYGYFNEFTKKYSETDFLRAVYEANYYRDPHMVILDEMNIARVEYYFAEMLSILEMPRQEEWKIDIVTATWDNDPCLINDGVIPIPNNIWFVGTINNDDSTFAVADKVYDRAIPIDLDSRADPFEAGQTPSIRVSTDHLNDLFDEAKASYSVTEEMEKKMDDLNAYLVREFKLAFGNRVIKQIRDFVPCYIACGGTETAAVDFIVAKKVLRKFESLNLGFMKDDLVKFETYLDRMFGRDQMKLCKEYVEYLRRIN
ncbi:MAG: hypothetical protein LIO39_04170 [Lachnospiraceae bacterium]|nr:hypothetical protein [Lachnospiraceae bacterium]